MLMSLFGTPSQLTQAFVKVVQETAAAGLGPYQSIKAGTEKEFREAWARRDHEHVVLFGEIPSREIVKLVVDAEAPTIVVIDDVDAIVRSCIRDRKMKGPEATRLACQSLATLHDLALAPRTLILGAAHASLHVEAAIAEIVSFYRISLDGSAYRALGERLNLDALGPAPIVRQLAPPPTEMAHIDEQFAARVLSGFAGLQHKQPTERFDWPPAVFISTNPKGQPIDGPLSLVGGRRCLIFGPYFHLPTGRWKASIQFGVSENISGNVLRVDVFSGEVLAEASARLPIEGRFACDIEFVIREPRLPLEIRLFNDEGAIEGVFELLGIVVTRAA